jgi:TolB-like protein
MKIALRLLAALFITLTLIAGGCGSSPSSKVDELDAAIRDTSDYLNNRIPKGSKIVILNIQSDSPNLSDYIIDELIANAVNDNFFTVVDRQQLDAIRAERDFQWSGEVSDDSAVAIGKIVGAQTIVSGAMSRLGDGYRIRIRALEVQTAQVQGQFNRNMASSPIIAALVASGGSTPSAAGSRTAQTTPAASTTPATPTAPAAQAAPATPATPPRTAYRVGEAGPAGGLIFYDKGNNSSGWRYLEAAPVEAEFQAGWSERSTSVSDIQETIGSGRRNTQLIVDTFRRTAGEWDTAAQKCDDLVYRGFDDWFLPSRAELDQMYGNLKRRDLGDFKNGWYWSSCRHIQDFTNGNMNPNYIVYAERHYVRPIRQVPGP